MGDGDLATIGANSGKVNDLTTRSAPAIIAEVPAPTTWPRSRKGDPLKPPRALLFDFDGVIANTENHHIAAWQRTFGLMGLEVDDEVCARAAEIDDREFLSDFFLSKKITDGDVAGWIGRKQEIVRMLLDDSPRVYPGVAELVDRVKQIGTVKLAVVTSTWRENVTRVLKSSGLFGSFTLIVAKEDVKAVKPDPEAYLRALECLSIPGSAAVALEDSPSGLASAVGAGVRTVAIGHRREKGGWSARSTYFRDLTKPDELLAAIGLSAPQ
jgi:HAD superfamily hydrolase (TIGR01509 family)